jgi:hypothetical protein
MPDEILTLGHPNIPSGLAVTTAVGRSQRITLLNKGESSEHRKGWKQWLSRANHAT